MKEEEYLTHQVEVIAPRRTYAFAILKEMQIIRMQKRPGKCYRLKTLQGLCRESGGRFLCTRIYPGVMETLLALAQEHGFWIHTWCVTAKGQLWKRKRQSFCRHKRDCCARLEITFTDTCSLDTRVV